MVELNALELAALCERAEADSWEDLILATPREFAAQFGLGVVRFGGVVAMHSTGFGAILLNRVMGLGIHRPATERLLDEVIAYYRHLHVKQFAIQLCPAAQPDTLNSWLLTRGFKRADNWVKVFRPAVPPDPIPTDLRVEEIGAAQRDLFGQTLAAGFGMPPVMASLGSGIVGRPGWHVYMTYDGDVPVGTGALYVNGEVGWLGAGATLSSHRGRGGQGAIMARRIADAVALSCKWVVTETGEELPERPNPSFHNMLRTGFQVGYLRANFISPA